MYAAPKQPPSGCHSTLGVTMTRRQHSCGIRKSLSLYLCLPLILEISSFLPALGWWDGSVAGPGSCLVGGDATVLHHLTSYNTVSFWWGEACGWQGRGCGPQDLELPSNCALLWEV